GSGQGRGDHRIAPAQDALLEEQRAARVIDQQDASGLGNGRGHSGGRGLLSKFGDDALAVVDGHSHMRGSVCNANRRMATINESASIPSKLTFRLPGNLNSRGPFTETPLISPVRYPTTRCAARSTVFLLLASHPRECG